MTYVYVQNKNGEPLMPTTRCGAVRRWLRNKKAVVVNLCPFTIRMTDEHTNHIQKVTVGLDTGAVNVGCSAVSGKKVLYASETKLRTDISKKMQRRAMYRRNRRSRKTRYRQPRFDNRTKPKGWLPPSLQSKKDSTVKIVKELSKILPISKVRVEIAKFDTQKLQDPDIKGEEYQCGATEGYDNIRAYVFERDKYTCKICKKKDGIMQTHHIIQRKDGGSDRPDNLVCVHKTCHEELHKGLIQHKFKKPKSYKIEAQVTVLKDFIVSELRKYFDVEVTFGHITKRNRQRLNFPKSHCFDAVAICNPKKVERIVYHYQNICRPRGRYRLTQGTRSQQYLPTKRVFGYDVGDNVLCRKNGKIIGFIKGKMSTGYFIIGDIFNKTILKCCSHKYLELIEYGKTIQSQFIHHQT
jgi:N6-L-threonylcarbamoyladenine synthase